MLQLLLLMAITAVLMFMMVWCGWKPKKAMAFLLAAFMAMPCYGWGGDGFLLPFRGRRVGNRCANGNCVYNGPRRQAAAAMAQAGSYGHWGHQHATAGYGSSGQYGGYQAPTYGGSSGTYGSAVRSGGSAATYGGMVTITDQYGNVTYGRIVDDRAAAESKVAAATDPDCQCDCENCVNNRVKAKAKDTSVDQGSVDAFKNSLSSARRDFFKEQLQLARRVDQPQILLASK